MKSKVKILGKRLYSKTFIHLSVGEGIQSRSQFSIHLSIIFSRKLADKCMENQKPKFDKHDLLPSA